jgi:hypothetical protein
VTDTWSFRPGTLDRLIFDSVVAHNEYRLPERFEPPDVVVDVGGHIGTFAYAVARRASSMARRALPRSSLTTRRAPSCGAAAPS